MIIVSKTITKTKGNVGANSKLGKIQAPSKSIQSHGRPMTSDDNFAHNYIAEEKGTCSLVTFNPTEPSGKPITHESRHSTHRHVSKMSKDSEYIPRPDAKLVKKELIAESKRAAKDAAKAEAIDFLRENLPNDFEETAKAWRETDKRVLERGPLLGKVGMTLTVTCVIPLSIDQPSPSDSLRIFQTFVSTTPRRHPWQRLTKLRLKRRA